MMAVGLSDMLLRETAGDRNVRIVKAFRSGTGLARPDVFDWIREYQRTAAFLEMLTQNGARVVWVGLPPMKSGQYDQKTAEINRIAFSVVSQYPQATWWNPQPYIGDESGAYREFQTTPDGKSIRLRAPDGIHLSDEGAALLSPALISWLNAAPPTLTAELVPPAIPKAPAVKASVRRRRHN